MTLSTHFIYSEPAYNSDAISLSAGSCSLSPRERLHSYQRCSFDYDERYDPCQLEITPLDEFTLVNIKLYQYGASVLFKSINEIYLKARLGPRIVVGWNLESLKRKRQLLSKSCDNRPNIQETLLEGVDFINWVKTLARMKKLCTSSKLPHTYEKTTPEQTSIMKDATRILSSG